MAAIIPKTQNDITEAWIQQNTGLKPVQGSVSIDGNIQKGIGFLSNLCRVSFKLEDGTQKYILVKLLPENPEFRAITIGQNFDKVEIKFYNTVKPELLLVSPELEVNFCRDYGGKFVESDDAKEYGSMLIMEDLKPAGYVMFDSNGDSWEQDLRKILEFLAKFHASGLALEAKKNMKISQLYPFCTGVNDTDVDALLQLAADNEGKLESLLKRFNCPEEIQTSYARIYGKTAGIVRKILKKGHELPCILHGDLWPSNVMCHPDPEQPIKIIDWQVLSYRDHALELSPLLLTSIKKSEMEKDAIEKFIKYYYKEFLKAVEAKGIRNVVQRNEQEFLEYFNTWGTAYGFLWLYWSIDCFPNDEERLFKALVLLHEKYDVVNLMLNQT